MDQNVNPEIEAYDEPTPDELAKAEQEGREALADDLRVAAIFAKIQPEATERHPEYIAVFLDTLNDTYLCSKYSFVSPIEAIEGMDDKAQERYKLIQTLQV